MVFGLRFTICVVLKSITGLPNRTSRSPFCFMPTNSQPIAIISPIDVNNIRLRARANGQEWSTISHLAARRQERVQQRNRRSNPMADDERMQCAPTNETENSIYSFLFCPFAFELILTYYRRSNRNNCCERFQSNNCCQSTDHFPKMKVNDVNGLGWQRIYPNAGHCFRFGGSIFTTN